MTVLEEKLIVLTCVRCGVEFAVREPFFKFLRNQSGGEYDEEDETDGWFCCPNGHRQRYPESREDALKKRIIEQTKRAEVLEAENARLKRKAKRLERSRGRAKASSKRSTRKHKETAAA